MAKQYHPDLNKGNQAKFKEINQAYSVLSNSNTRKEYDQTRNVYSAQSNSNRTGYDSPFGNSQYQNHSRTHQSQNQAYQNFYQNFHQDFYQNQYQNRNQNQNQNQGYYQANFYQNSSREGPKFYYYRKSTGNPFRYSEWPGENFQKKSNQQAYEQMKRDQEERFRQQQQFFQDDMSKYAGLSIIVGLLTVCLLMFYRPSGEDQVYYSNPRQQYPQYQQYQQYPPNGQSVNAYGSPYGNQNQMGYNSEQYPIRHQ